MEKVVLTNMCMIYDDKGNILVQHRRKKVWPGVAFPGGKIEEGESIVSSTIREIKEETGLDVFNLKLVGVKDWYNSEDKVRTIVFLFKTNEYVGELISSDEGEVFWVKLTDIQDYDLASDFDKTLEVFLDDKINELYYDLADNIYKCKLL